MMLSRRFVLAAAAPLVLALAAAAPARKSPPPAPPAPLPDIVRVALQTTMGTITVEVDVRRAPVTATNFVRYVEQKRFDGTAFYRSLHLDWGEQPNGLIQAGTRSDPRRVLKPIAHEPTSQTGILHKAGTLSMARYAPGTATGDFSIMLSDLPSLDANPAAPDAEGQAGYAAFGRVVDGMDVVRRIWEAPRATEVKPGDMPGQMIAQPVVITTARRVPIPAPAQAPAAVPTAAPPPAG